jgi:predicted metal-dependent peptidase
MKGSKILRGKGRSKKSIRETIKNDLDINELDWDVYIWHIIAMSIDQCS